ncbi:hypothetical protein [Mesobacillus zeae]|uniref:Uncharacterized protein n=1 Tax=Mesobacillus zeae TaxID=1917180 RepID=A0A398BFX9_9BACI|nr:hypothetical protein [Mesobacillus zeae]RID88952.1 hypothetical protein D1970_00165 [Mesobacillus zeae]
MRKAHNRIDLPAKEIAEKYNSGMTAEAIGKHYDVAKKTILTRLKEEGITRRQQPSYNVDSEWLRIEYVDKKRSTRDIAEEVGCSSKHIAKQLHKHAIPIRKHCGAPEFTKQERVNKWAKPLDEHPLWKGGVTSLNEHLRTATFEWRMECLQSTRFTCVVTGMRHKNLDVHHTKAFNEIRDESIAELGLLKHKKVSDYTVEEIASLFELIKQKHENIKGYPIGRSLHKEFHKQYGVHATESDFEEFIRNYNEKEAVV